MRTFEGMYRWRVGGQVRVGGESDFVWIIFPIPSIHKIGLVLNFLRFRFLICKIKQYSPHKMYVRIAQDGSACDVVGGHYFPLLA